MLPGSLILTLLPQPLIPILGPSLQHNNLDSEITIFKNIIFITI